MAGFHEPKGLLVTGGYGFIGSNFIRFLFEKKGFTGRVINLDLLTYAANPHNLDEFYPISSLVPCSLDLSASSSSSSSADSLTSSLTSSLDSPPSESATSQEKTGATSQELRRSGAAASGSRVEEMFQPTAGHEVYESTDGRYIFVHGSISDRAIVGKVFERYKWIDTVVNFAAETHVDRSIRDPRSFVETNVVGTLTLLQEAARAWGPEPQGVRFHHVSTDEVFGSADQPEQRFSEGSPYQPRSPYSASKAAADHLVRAWFHTYGFPVTISNCSNNYGPYQFPEKLIPFMLSNLLKGLPLPLYGDGRNVRDWLHVEDHAAAIWTILTLAAPGSTYLIGGQAEMSNIDLVRQLCALFAELRGLPSAEAALQLITFVKDRPGHDFRYAIDSSKLTKELGWSPSRSFHEGLRSTLQWYLDHQDWIAQVSDGRYQEWIKSNYTERHAS